MSNPLVSIVMNCFNGQRFLERSLKSIISQKYENFELIFWDNLSKDESEKFLGSLRIKDLNTLNQLLTKHYMKQEMMP